MFCPKKKYIIKDLLKLKITIKNSKIKTMKNTTKSSKIKTKKHYDYDDIEYKGIRDVKNLFDDIDEDYYKPIGIGNAFSSNYIEYQSNGDKDRILSVKEYLDMIRQYLRDIINNHKTQNEWKIQLSLAINFVPSKNFKETLTMHTNSDNIDITVGYERDQIIEKLFNSLL